MKKILLISLETPPAVGGIATYVGDLARSLDPTQVILLAPPMKDSKEWDKSQPFAVIRSPFLFPRFFWPRWIRLIPLLRRVIRENKIDIMMVHHTLPVGYGALVMKRWLKTPFLLFSHGTDLLAGTQTPWKKRMTAMVAGGAEQIIFNSESLKRRFLRVIPEMEAKARVVYPCPDPLFLEPPDQKKNELLRERYALHGKRVLLSVSRLDDGKGFPHLIRMMPALLARVPHLVWLIVGDGPKRVELLKSIQKANLQNVVRYIGEIPHRDLKPYYDVSEVFALLTHPDEGREEGLGLVFLEAAAAGKPIVAGKSGGVEEAVLHTETGIIVDIFKGDPPVIEAIAGLFEERVFAERLGRQGRERIKTQFLWQNQIAKLHPWIL